MLAMKGDGELGQGAYGNEKSIGGRGRVYERREIGQVKREGHSRGLLRRARGRRLWR